MEITNHEHREVKRIDARTFLSLPQAVSISLLNYHALEQAGEGKKVDPRGREVGG